MCYHGNMGVEQILNAAHLQRLQTFKVFIWGLFSQFREEGGAHLPYYQVQSLKRFLSGERVCMHMHTLYG